MLSFYNRIYIPRGYSKLCYEDALQNKEVTLPNESSNYNNYEFDFVKETDDFHVKDRQGILNAIYTILNHGMPNFTFYCDSHYDTCLDELNEISQDQVLLSTVNNLCLLTIVTKKFILKYLRLEKCSIEIDKLYSDEEVTEVNNKISEFEKNNIKDGMSTREKIKAFHDI